MNAAPAIKSRWRVSAQHLTSAHVTYTINSLRGLCCNLSSKFLEKNYKNLFTFNEINGVAREGVYRAILAYKPEKGDFVSYCRNYCWSWINCYAKTIYSKANFEICISDYIEDGRDWDGEIEFDIAMGRLEHLLSDTEYKVVEGLMHDIPIHELMQELGMETRYEYSSVLAQALAKAKQVLE